MRSSSAKARGPVCSTTPATKRSASRSRSQVRWRAERRSGRGVGLDLDSDHARAPELGDEVDLLTRRLRAYVVEPRAALGHRELRTQLGRDECVQQPAEQVSVAEHAAQIQAERCGHQRGLDDVALRGADQPLEPVRLPRGHLVDDVQPGEQVVVVERGHAVDACSLIDRLVLGAPGRVQRVRLEITTHPYGIPWPRGGARRSGNVAGEQVVQIALHPRLVRDPRQSQRGRREPAAQRQFDVSAQVRRIRGNGQLGTGGEPVEEAGLLCPGA